MAHRRYYRTARRRGGPRRKFIWARKAGRGIINAPDTEPPGLNLDCLDDFKAAYGADLLGATLVRVRGQILVHIPDQAAMQAGLVVVGMRTYTESPDGDVVDEETPLDQPYGDWLMYQPSIIWKGRQLVDPTNCYAVHRYDVDIKSSRRFEELGDGLLLSASHDVVGVTGQLVYNLSFGIKLA